MLEQYETILVTGGSGFIGSLSVPKTRSEPADVGGDAMWQRQRSSRQ